MAGRLLLDTDILIDYLRESPQPQLTWILWQIPSLSRQLPQPNFMPASCAKKKP